MYVFMSICMGNLSAVFQAISITQNLKFFIENFDIFSQTNDQYSLLQGSLKLYFKAKVRLSPSSILKK